MDTLAAAYAEAGKFQDAITTQKKVIKLLKEEGKTKELTEYIERLKSYQAHKPWREMHISAAAESGNFPKIETIKDDSVNIRLKPTTQSPVIGKVRCSND